MGNLPEHVVLLVLKTSKNLNRYEYKKVLIDLKHVNFGKSGKKQRSSISKDDFKEIIFLLNDEYEEISTDEGFKYFQTDLIWKDRPYRLVFLTEDNSDYIGIITFYRIKQLGEFA